MSTRSKKASTAKPAPLLRTYLSVTKELASLPWEALTLDDQPVFFQPYSSLARISAKRLLALQDEEMWPIHITVVVGADQGVVKILKIREEIYALERSIRETSHAFIVKVFYADKAARNGLQLLKEEIEKNPPDILHFVGHATDNPPGLMINDHAWSYTSIETWIKTVDPIRLVYLNACRTQVPAQAMRSVSAAFLNGGALSTVAMLADVKGVEAGECAARFYEFLVGGYPVDVALSLARAKLSVDKRGAFLPVLTVKADPTRLLPSPCCALPAGGAVPARPAVFIDRHDHRRKLLHHFFTPKAGKRRYVLGLKGLTGLGKTALSWWCLGTLAWRNLLVIRTDAGNYKDWFGLLTAIANGDGGDLQPLPPQPLEEFRKLVEDAKTIEGVKNIEKFFAAFLEGLRAAAGERQVILCIDEWKKTERSGDPLTYLGPLIKYLFNPIANGDGKIRALIPADWDNIPIKHLEPLIGGWEMVPLEKFAAAEFRDLALELYGATYPDTAYPEELDVEMERRPATQPMTPEELRQRFNAFLTILEIPRRP